MTLFFYGPNTYALQRQIAGMVGAYIKKTGSDLGFGRVAGADITLEALKAGLLAAPFLSSSRLVIVEDVSFNKGVSGELAGLLSEVPATTVALFVERHIDQRTAVFKVLKTANKVLKFEPLTGAKLVAWARAEAQAHGGVLRPAVAEELVRRAGDDQWRLSNEIAKLVGFAPEVTVEAVREMVESSVEQSIFDLVEAMSGGKAAAALRGYQVILRQKQSEMYVLTMVQWQLRNLLLVKLAPAAMSPAEVAAEAGLSPYVAGKAAELAARIPEVTLRRAFAAAAECEYHIKSGLVKAEDGVEALIWRIAAATAQKGP